MNSNWLAEKQTRVKIVLTTILVAVGVAISALHALSRAQSSQEIAPGTQIVWRPLAIGAGGQLTGIDIAPDGTKVVKTDVFGAYIWNAGTNRWDQLITASAGRAALANPQGVWEIRIAPSLTSRLFMIYDNEVYRSDDRGASWLKSSLRGVSEADANGKQKFANQKMAIDPANPNIIYVGTPRNGVWRSFDAGGTWQRIEDIPAGMNPGHAGIVFDAASSTTNGRTKTIYVPSFGKGVWKSADAGVTWTEIANLTIGGPTNVWTAQIGIDGVYWCSDRTDVWKYAGSKWDRILPNGRHYAAEAVVTDPKTSGRVILSGPEGGKSGVETLDNGATWVGRDFWHATYPSPGQRQIANDIPWLSTSDTSYMTIGDMKIDPVDDLIYFAQGIGVWKANWPKNFMPFDWISQSLGIEELVANDVIAPLGGKPITATWDRPFFRSNHPDEFPNQYGPINGVFAGGWGLDYASSDPSFIVGLANWGAKDSSGYSTDGGQTWHQFAKKPDWKLGGCIAAATPENIVWVSANNGLPFLTKDGGATWKAAPDLPSEGWIFAYYLKRHIVTADRVNIGTFYLYNFKTGLFRSSTGGDSWSLIYPGEIAPSSAYNATLRATPDYPGHLWFTSGPQTTEHPYSQGFFKHSRDGGITWRTVPHVMEVSAFGFGKSKTPNTYPSIYIAGWVHGEYGIWRSDDEAITWNNMGRYPNNSVDHVTAISGDMNSYGVVYVGFGGSGFAYGKF